MIEIGEGKCLVSFDANGVGVEFTVFAGEAAKPNDVVFSTMSYSELFALESHILESTRIARRIIDKCISETGKAPREL